MKPKKQILILISSLLFCSCINNNIDEYNTSKREESLPIYKKDSLFFKDETVFELSIDSSLMHQRLTVFYDSIIGVDYIGFNGEHSFYPIGNNGKWVHTIINFQKLSINQAKRLNHILGNKLTYNNPNIVSCYEPRLAFIFFNQGKIIGQVQVCLECAQLRSTARIGNNKYGGLINQAAIDKLDSLRIELGLTSKMIWE